MTPEQIGFLSQCATRYCLGRMTSAPQQCADILMDIWHELSEPAQTAIRRDVERAFAVDDEQRARGVTEYRELGQDCDRADWQRVRALWS